MSSSSRNADERIRLAFLIRSLGVGGAERQLTALAQHLDKTRFDVAIFCFYDDGAFAQELRDAGIAIISLQKKGRWDVFGFLKRLIGALRCHAPHILHGYLGMPNILALAVKPFVGSPKVVFGVRYAVMDLSKYDWLFRLEYAMERALGDMSDLIITNSQAAARIFCAGRSPGKGLIVIRNGIDTEVFRPDATKGGAFRRQWGIAEDVCLIGMAGRIDPMKGIPVFLAAAKKALGQNPNLVFAFAGSGQEAYTTQMQTLSSALDLESKVMWCGEQKDMTAYYNALDVLCSASYGESLSNVICEAMACGTPCVVTDVGDSAFIAGETGLIIPADDAERMAQAFLEMAAKSPAAIVRRQELARQRILSEFSLKRLVAETESALDALVN